MTSSKILPISFLATMTVLAGLSVATAQTSPKSVPIVTETSAQSATATRVDFRNGMGHGKHGGRGMMRQMMQKVDANGDGAVTQAEIDTFRAALVAEADASGDGDISLDEFETIYLNLTRERMVDAFQRLDADGDGVVTQAEMDRQLGGIVSRMDRNDDGKLDRADRGGRDKKGHGRKGYDQKDQGQKGKNRDGKGRDGQGQGQRQSD